MEHETPQHSAQNTPQIHTYHCLCSQLLLASADPLESHSQRSGEGLDKAYAFTIVPSDALLSVEPSESDHDLNGLSSHMKGLLGQSVHVRGGTVLLNTSVDKKAVVVQRSDGFEPRYQRRCGRCHLIIGYHLDSQQLHQDSQPGRNDAIFYVLPGSLNSTNEMLND